MRVRLSDADLGKLVADLAVCFAFEGDREPRGVSDAGLRATLARQMKADGFRGQPNDAVLWNADGRHGARRFAVLGLGRIREEVGNPLRTASARAARLASSVGAKRLALRLPPCDAAEAPGAARAAVEGALLGDYAFERHLTERDRRVLRLTALEVSAGRRRPALARAVRLGQAGAEAVAFARDLVNEGPSRKSPEALARQAVAAAKRAGLGCRVLGPAEIRRQGLHALLAVARGSERPARVVHLVYRPRGARKGERTVLVGKGVTFDSGGLNLKPSDSMRWMKMDMAGAAAVLAAMTALAEVGCKTEVHGLLGLVENMNGGDAYKPGDILDTYRGKSVEVGNTDAEGRLVLCDLLAWAADRLAPSRLVDLATLTGACVVALGPGASGLFTRDEALAVSLAAAAGEAGERLWRLPLYDEYLPMLQKGPADLCSTAGRWGGAITAALFLGEFVPRGLAWAHLDIAGPAFAEEPLPEARLGGTGAGVLTLLRWLEGA